jgi:class 3 adenylate cyclase
MQRTLDGDGKDGSIGVRIGIHAGEPIEEDGDIHGTSVVRAARIMETARPGQILVSSLVRELVAGRPFSFVDRGMHELKGIDEPTRLHDLEWHPERHHGRLG